MKFIRIDMKGHWRGNEHQSSVGVSSFVEGHEMFEEGISCYDMTRKGMALDSLYEYWREIAMKHDAEEYEGMQITIFEGEKLDVDGADGEDIAVCERTLAEIDAVEIMEQIVELYERHEYDQELDYDEYLEELEKIELGI